MLYMDYFILYGPILESTRCGERPADHKLAHRRGDLLRRGGAFNLNSQGWPRTHRLAQQFDLKYMYLLELGSWPKFWANPVNFTFSPEAGGASPSAAASSVQRSGGLVVAVPPGRGPYRHVALPIVVLTV